MEADFRENIVVGNGIMAKQLMFKLSEKYSDITCISSEAFAPSCSRRSTAINCLRGTKANVSELGDLIRESYTSFENFYNEFKPPGVSRSYEVQTWLENGASHAKWLRRYGSYELTRQQRFNLNKAGQELCTVNTEAYFISADILLDWYEDKLHNVNFVDAFVNSVSKVEDGYVLSLQTGEVFKCKRLFLCMSYMSDMFFHLCEKDEDRERLKKQKQVYGHYLEYKLEQDESLALDLSHSFCLSYEFIRMVYRKESHDIVISFPDQNKDAFIHDKKYLASLYNEFKTKLNLNGLPHLDAFALKQGIRCKGHQRLPFCEKINENLFCCSGLYKNAWTFSYLFSEKITDFLKN